MFYKITISLESWDRGTAQSTVYQKEEYDCYGWWGMEITNNIKKLKRMLKGSVKGGRRKEVRGEMKKHENTLQLKSPREMLVLLEISKKEKQSIRQ